MQGPIVEFGPVRGEAINGVSVGDRQKYKLDRLPRRSIWFLLKTPGHRRIPVDISGEDVSELINQMERLGITLKTNTGPRIDQISIVGRTLVRFIPMYIRRFHVSFKDAMERCNALSLL